MPELPEVENVVRGLAREVTGRRIEAVHLARRDIVHGAPEALWALLHRRRIERIERRGKLVALRLDRGLTLYVHLGMSGRLLVCRPDAPLEPHTHLRITLHPGASEVRYCDPRRFGGVWLVNGEDETSDDWVGRRLPPVGEDPLGVSLPRLTALLQRRRQIKALLLDQQPISGLGNIYCDETLHRARIHPLTRAADLQLDDVRRLRQIMRRVLREAIRAGGSSISDYRRVDNTPGTFQHRHRVYHREGRPCRTCRTPIERIIAAGRSTFLCPQCQPEPEKRCQDDFLAVASGDDRRNAPCARRAVKRAGSEA